MKKHTLFVFGLLSAFLVSCRTDVITSNDNNETNQNTQTEGETSEGHDHDYDHDHEEGGGSNTDPHKNHTIYHYAARNATCTEPGNLEAWYCYNDRTYYLTNPGGTVIDTESIIPINPSAAYYIAPTGHDLEFTGFEWNDELTAADAVYTCKNDSAHTFRHSANIIDLTEPDDLPTCSHGGTKTVRATYEDQTDTQVKAFDHLEHELMYVQGKPATCTKAGTLPHYVCTREDCRATFILNSLTNQLEETTDIVDPAKDHTPAERDDIIKEATCTEPGSKVHVTYCSVCGTELSRSEEEIIEPLGNDHEWGEWVLTTNPSCGVEGQETRTCSRCGLKEARPVEALDHSWGEWEITTEPTCESVGEETRECSKCHNNETRPVEALGHAWSEWEVTTQPTCTEKGEETRECSRCHKEETREVEALGHDYGNALYTWDSNKQTVTSTRTCSNDAFHVEVTHPYTYQEPFFTCEGGRSELAGSLTEKEKNGDINLYFAHKDGSEYLSFDVDMVFHVVHEKPLNSMDENYVIRFDNGCHYTATLGVNTNSGDSYALFYTDLTTGNKTYSVGTPTDNRDLYTSYINGSFENDYKIFAQDCINVINAHYDASSGELVLTITYFTLVEGYERYLGYKQTFTATVDENDRNNFNYVDSLRLTRTQNASKEVHSIIYIEGLSLNEGKFHHDPLNYYSANDGWFGAEAWHYKEILDLDGHTLQKVAAKEPTCLEDGNIEYYKCLSHEGEYYLDSEMITPTTLEEVILPALNHDYDLENITYELIEGNTKVRATVPCKRNEDPSHILVKETPVSSVEHQNPTEQDSGFDKYYFEFEDEIFTSTYIEVEIPPLSHVHNYETFVEKVEATCTTAGYDIYECSCGDQTHKNEVEALGHDLEHHDGQAATCTEHGWEEYDTCSRCDYTTYVELPAAGHNLEHHEALEATCTEPGHNAYDTCKNCDYTTYEATEALGHNWGEWTETTAPTCDHEGEETRECSRCHEEEHHPVGALGHDYKVTYSWVGTGHTEVKATYTCTNNNEHTYNETPYAYKEASFICEGGRSELAGSLTEKEKNGDINFYFTHKNGDNKLSFNVDLTLRVVHDNNLSSMKDNFIIRFDNGCHYKATLGVNTNSGDSYAIFYTDLTTANKAYSTGTPTDNRALYTSYINGSFEEDYKVFAANSVILINADYNGETGELTLTITYFTLVEGYERYLGYKQTFLATVDDNDRDNFNIVDSLRITRTQDSNKNVDSKIYIEDITRNQGTYDYDVLNYYSANDGWFGAEAWHSKTIIEVDGHDLVYVEGVEPTCTEEGHEAYYTCKNHDNEYFLDELATQKLDSLDSLTIAATGHDYGDVHYEAVDGDNKVRAYRICQTDETHIEEETVSTVYTVVTEPTCTEKGQGKYTATFTNEAFETRVKYVDIPALGHDYGEATYVWNGDNTKVTASRTCSRCDEVESEEVAVTSEVIKAATEQEEGIRRYTSSAFENEAFEVQIKDVTIPTLAHVHNYSEFVETVAPTCTEQGYDIYKCSCDDITHINYTDALGHNVEHHEAEASTCKDQGHIEYWHCSRCNKDFSDETLETEVSNVLLPLSTEHTPATAVNENVVNPTCTEAGSHDEVVYCSVCGQKLSSEHVDDEALGHDWGDWTQTIAPTCTEKGEEEHVCSVCGAKETREVDANGHTPAGAVNENVVNPTCTETGSHDEVVYCSVCNAEISRQTKEDAAFGHDLEHHDGQDPTCEEHGWKAYDTCKREGCEYTTYEEIPALGHDYKVAYTWVGTGHTEVKATYTCEHNNEHTYNETPYSKAESDLYTLENVRTELASNMAANYRDGGKYGDINYFFKYKNDVTDAQKAFNVDTVLRVNRDTAISSMKDLLIIRVDNSFRYSNSSGSGGSYAIFYTDLSTEVDNNNKYSASSSDNRSEYASALIGTSFISDYRAFTKNTVIKINSHLDTETMNIVTTLTYFPLDEDYKGYLGYTQTFVANISADANWNTVNSIKITRARESGDTVSTNMVIESITLKEGVYDNDVLANKYRDTFIMNERFDDMTIVNVDGHTIQRVEAKEATCTETGNIEYYRCLTHENEYYLDQDCNEATTLEEVTLAKVAHTLTGHAAVAPTCTSTGNIAYWTCDVCGHYFLDAEAENEVSEADTILPVAATSHNYDPSTITYSWAGDYSKVTASIRCSHDNDHVYQETVNITDDHITAHKDETEDTNGYTTYQVSFESPLFSTQSKTQIINATGHIHNMEEHEEVASTCYSQGHDAYWYCTKCGNYYTNAEGTGDPTTLEELTRDYAPHSYSDVWIIDDDCHYQKCSVCDAISAPVAHTPAAPVTENATEATCTMDGHHDSVVYCSECGRELSREHIKDAHTNHTWVGIGKKWTGLDTSTPTLSNTYTCSNDGCNEVRRDVIFVGNSDPILTVSGNSFSQVANDTTGKSKRGDVNMSFVQNGNGTSFHNTTYLRIEHDGQFADAKDVLLVRIDNGMGYLDLTKQEGDDYFLIYSDYTAEVDTVTKGFTFNEYGSNKSSFNADEFRYYMQKALVIIDVDFNVVSANEGVTTVTITYYTMMEGEQAEKYTGYTQTFVATMGSDTGWTSSWGRGTVKTTRIARPVTSDDSSTTYIIDKIYQTDNLANHITDKDDNVIRNYNHELTEVAEVPATCTTEGVKHHYTCKNHPTEYWLDSSYYEQATPGELIIPALGHSLEVMEYFDTMVYHCKTCNKYYSDEDCQYELDICGDFVAKVNNVEVQIIDVRENNDNKAKYEVSLKENDVTRFFDGEDNLYVKSVDGVGCDTASYTATENGKYTFYINNSNEVHVVTPGQSRTVIVTKLPDWVLSDASVKVMACIIYEDNSGTWVPVTVIDDNSLYFEANSKNVRFLLVRTPVGTEVPNWNIHSGTDVGRIYNKTEDISLNDSQIYYGYGDRWQDYN